MPGITLKNSLISYYGNPAGYTEKEKAVVDRIFQNEELSTWLQSRSLTPEWVDGVMERLLAGERMECVESVPLKKVRIWQLKPEMDVRMKFICLDDMVKEFGGPHLEHYHMAYDGYLGTNELEAIYTRCNVNHPAGFTGHSLSMSDVVELYDDSSSEYHYCDRFGFRQISFSPEPHSQDMVQSMSQSL